MKHLIKIVLAGILVAMIAASMSILTGCSTAKKMIIVDGVPYECPEDNGKCKKL